MDPKTLLSDYFNDNDKKDMQLATTVDGQPWQCTVYFAADDSNNLYWASSKNRRHSQEILANSKVAVTIVKDNIGKQALQITGQAIEVDEEEIEHAHATYCAKYGDKPGLLAAILDGGPEGPAYWVVRPTTIALYDERNFPTAPKQEISLD